VWIMWIVIALIIVAGIPFTLWWWKKADQWADAEHKRFKVKVDTRERVVVSKGDQTPQGGPPG